MRPRKNLSMWSALPPYLGGKRRLCPLIFREIDKVVPRRLWEGMTFLDAFLGGGSVSLFAKALGFRVIGTDIAERSIIVGEALVANNRVRLTKADVLRILAPRDKTPGPVEREMVPEVFTRSQARVIDGALCIAASTGDVAKAALLKLLAVRIALLAHPYSYVRKGTIRRMTTGEYESITPKALPQYVNGLRLTSVPRLWGLAQQINRGVFEGHGEVYQTDIFEMLPTITAHVMYADPPYAATTSYERTYKLIDRILERTSRPISPFTAKDGATLIDTILERARHIPVWVLSFGNEAATLGELEVKMRRWGRETRAIEIPYSRLAALSSLEKSSRDRELLVVGWDAEAVVRMTRNRPKTDHRGNAEILAEAR